MKEPVLQEMVVRLLLLRTITSSGMVLWNTDLDVWGRKGMG